MRAIASIVLLIAGTAPLQAAQTTRSGFLIGFAGGLVGSDVSAGQDDRYSYTEGQDAGWGLKLTIGGALNDRFALSGTHVVSSTRIDGNQHFTMLLGATATGWLLASPASPYASLTLGRQLTAADSYRFASDRESRDNFTGYAARVAVGYEFSNRMLVELAYTGIERGRLEYDGSDLEFHQVQLFGGWHW